jgi:two-component system chemotaxis sensor kinase CheA
LPLTLAIVQSLLVTIKDEIFAIPLASVIESIRVAADEIQKVGDTEVIKLRNKVLPLVHLDKILNLNAKKGTISDMLQKSKTLTLGSHKPITSKRDKHFVVVVGTLERPFGIVVDHLLNQQEMVIKSMGAIMNDVPAVAGGAVLGNGDVVVVLDIMEIQDNFALKNSRITA